MNKANFICAFCNKAFTRNASLKRHKQNMHFNPSFKCITCPKSYKRQEDLLKHSKTCLTNALNKADDSVDSLHQPGPSMQEHKTVDLTKDLALSSSDSDTSITENIMASHLNKLLTEKHTRSIEVNTDSSRIHSEDKATQTEPLIILTPDEISQFRDGLTIATFTNNIQIFVDTLNSQIIMSRPNLCTPPEPTTQVGLLRIQPSATKGSQTKTSPENTEESPTCQRKPTRPSLVVPKCRRDLLKIPQKPGTSSD